MSLRRISAYENRGGGGVEGMSALIERLIASLPVSNMAVVSPLQGPSLSSVMTGPHAPVSGAGPDNRYSFGRVWPDTSILPQPIMSLV